VGFGWWVGGGFAFGGGFLDLKWWNNWFAVIVGLVALVGRLTSWLRNLLMEGLSSARRRGDIPHFWGPLRQRGRVESCL